MNKKGTITIVGSMAGLSAGIAAAIRAAEKAGVEVVCVEKQEAPKLEDLIGCVYELRPNQTHPFFEQTRNEPWRSRPKREKYRR